MKRYLAVLAILALTAILAYGNAIPVVPIATATRAGLVKGGGAGISIAADGTIEATGVPIGFNDYTSAGGGRATNGRVDSVQDQVTAQAVGAALGATSVQPTRTVNGQPLSSNVTIATITGNAGTATALFANGTNCSAGQVAAGVDASGSSEGCLEVLQPSAIGVTVQPYNAGTVTAITDSTSTTSSTTAASATAVKAAKDAADLKLQDITANGQGITKRTNLDFAGTGLMVSDGGTKTTVTGTESLQDINGGTFTQNTKMGANGNMIYAYASMSYETGGDWDTGFGDLYNNTMARLDQSFARMHDMGIRWYREVSPLPANALGGAATSGALTLTGAEGWEAVDRAVLLARKYGIKIILCIPQPYYSNTNYKTYAAYKDNWLVPLATYMATRYKNDADVVYLEPVNEINGLFLSYLTDASNGASVDPRWVDMHVAAYDAIKAAAPGIKVPLSSISEWEGGTAAKTVNMLDQLNTASQMAKFDEFVATHLYPSKPLVVSPNYYSNGAISSGAGSYGDVAVLQGKLNSYGRTGARVSVGEFGLVWDILGRVSTTAGSAVVTGTSTTFVTGASVNSLPNNAVTAGDVIRLEGDTATYTVLSVDSETQLTLTTTYPSTRNQVGVINSTIEARAASALTWMHSTVHADSNVVNAMVWQLHGSERSIYSAASGAIVPNGLGYKGWGLYQADTGTVTATGTAMKTANADSNRYQKVKARTGTAAALPASADLGELLFETDTDTLKIGKGIGASPVVIAGSGVGDVVGPASATSGNVVVFSGTTGKLIADGGGAPTKAPATNSADYVPQWNGANSALLKNGYPINAYGAATTLIATDANGIVTIKGGGISPSVTVQNDNSSSGNKFPNFTARNYYGSGGGFANMTFQNNAGTAGTPTSTGSGITLGGVYFGGYHTEGTPGETQGGAFQFTTEGAFTDANQRTKFDLRLSTDASNGTPRSVFSVDHAGNAKFALGKFTYDAASGKLLLTSNAGIAADYSLVPGAKIHMIGENSTAADDSTLRQDMYSASAFSAVHQYRSRGDKTTFVKINSGDKLGVYGARGYYGVQGSGGGFPTSATAAIFPIATEDFNDSTHVGTAWAFETVPNGSGTRSERMRVTGTGVEVTGSLSVSGSITASNVPIIYTATASALDFGSLAAATCGVSSDITVSGVSVGDFVQVSTGSPVFSLRPEGYISATDTVKIWYCNHTAGAIDPAAADFYIRVTKR